MACVRTLFSSTDPKDSEDILLKSIEITQILSTTGVINPLKPELNPICYLLALLGAHHFLHVTRIRVKLLSFRLLMSYIYGAPILDVSRSHTTTQHNRQDSSRRVISSSQRPLPDNTRHSQQTNIHAPARLLRSWVRIPPGAWIFVCCERRVLSGRGLCDELITRLEESYRLCCVVVCDLETSRMGAPYIYIYIYIYDISSLWVKSTHHIDLQ